MPFFVGNGYEASLDMKLPDYSTTLSLVNGESPTSYDRNTVTESALW